MTEAAVLRGVRAGGDHVDPRLSCPIVSALENKIIINNDRKREPAGWIPGNNQHEGARGSVQEMYVFEKQRGRD